MFRLAYNTNGLAHHRLCDALPLLAELGYEGVAITPDAGQLDPFHLRPDEVGALREQAAELGLALAIETGSRYLLDARRKHQPTLLDALPRERQRRADFVRLCLDLAAELGAAPVSIWSGSAPGDARGDARDVPPHAHPALWDRLCEGLSPLLEHARLVGVPLSLEPEPGMFLERPAGYLALLERLGSAGDELGLTLDLGHLLVTRDLPVEDQIRALAPRLMQVHLDDIANAQHEHLMFGLGELDLAAALRALIEVGYAGMAAVELSRDSHRGAWAAAEALKHLRQALTQA